MKNSFSQWIREGKDLPVLPITVMKILSVTQEESHAEQVAEIIRKDVGLTAAILKLANSSIFGLLRKISSIDQAVILLGYYTLRNIALSVSLLNLFPPKKDGFLSKAWERSLVTAIAGRELSRMNGYRKGEDAFTAGLLHEIGLIALYRYNEKLAIDFVAEQEMNGRFGLEEEEKRLGIDHVQAGKILSDRWNLPGELTTAIVSHHEEPPVEESQTSKLRQVSYLAALVGDIFFFGKKRESIQRFADTSYRLMNISQADSEFLLQNMHDQLVGVASSFDIKIGEETSYDEMIRRANEEIVSVTVSNEATKFHLSQAFERERMLSEQLKEANQNLKIMARKDGLTGLYNRQFFNELLEKEWSRAARQGYFISLIMVDVDDFKNVNDTYGHPAGDVAIREIAIALINLVRQSDYVARYGGEEFAVIMPQSDLPQAFMAAERLRAGIQNLNICLEGIIQISLTVSCGVSAAFPKNSGSVVRFLQEADDALYEAKRGGRNQVLQFPVQAEIQNGSGHSRPQVLKSFKRQAAGFDCLQTQKG